MLIMSHSNKKYRTVVNVSLYVTDNDVLWLLNLCMLTLAFTSKHCCAYRSVSMAVAAWVKSSKTVSSFLKIEQNYSVKIYQEEDCNNKSCDPYVLIQISYTCHFAEWIWTWRNALFAPNKVTVKSIRCAGGWPLHKMFLRLTSTWSQILAVHAQIEYGNGPLQVMTQLYLPCSGPGKKWMWAWSGPHVK